MYKSSLIIFNIMKKRNFGGIIRTADALGISEIVFVGRKKFYKFGHFSTNDTENQCHFYTLEESISYLRSKQYAIAGVEITPDALPIESHPFRGHTAFLLGNEASGLTEQQKDFCDYFVSIKQCGKAASLNVNVAAGIVFHHFAVWANFSDNPIENNKYLASSRLNT